MEKSTRARKGIDWSLGEVSHAMTPLETFLFARDKRVKSLLIVGLALTIVVFILYRAQFGGLSARTERSLIVALLLCYAFLRFPLTGNWNDKVRWSSIIDIVCFVLSLATGIYVLWGELITSTQHFRVEIFGESLLVDWLVGIIVLLLVLEATRRTMGWIITILPIIFFLYAIFANYAPGFFENPPIDWRFFIEQLFVEGEGVYGIGSKVLISMLLLFLLFGTLLTYTRTGAFFIALANSLMGRQTGGPAKMAVASSALMGTMSGSAVANVVTTGAITIPMMKDMGYKSEFAAGVESVASNGGQIMPPIMGASAFLMAAWLGIPYSHLILYAAIPAILYFVCLYVTVHQRASTMGLRGLDREQIPSFRQVMREGGHLLIPIVVLFGALFAGYSITRVGLWACLSVIVLSFVRKETRLSPLRLLTALEAGLHSAAPIGIACIMIGILIGTITTSGLGLKISMLVIDLSGGSLIIALLLSAVMAVILGMGMPTLLVYMNMVLFVTPALVQLGLTPLTAHLFAFYFGIVSGITPPVCLVAFAGAGVAGSPPMKTGFTAARIGFASYLLPFMIAYSPALVIQGASAGTIVQAFTFSLLGLILFALTIEGHFFRKMNIPERILALAGAVALVIPNIGWNLGGLGLFAALIILQKLPRGAEEVKREKRIT